MDKYTIQVVIPSSVWYNAKQQNDTPQTLLRADNVPMATFYDAPMARKVCDLLNETSRSQGKWPK